MEVCSVCHDTALKTKKVRSVVILLFNDFRLAHARACSRWHAHAGTVCSPKICNGAHTLSSVLCCTACTYEAKTVYERVV